MNLSLVFGGRVRLDEERRERRALRRAQLWADIESRYEAELKSAGFLKRFSIRWGIRKDAASMMKNEISERSGAFCPMNQTANQSLQPTAPSRRG